MSGNNLHFIGKRIEGSWLNNRVSLGLVLCLFQVHQRRLLVAGIYSLFNLHDVIVE
jgi:hypothetical protein